jgi:hypothetical protein
MAAAGGGAVAAGVPGPAAADALIRARDAEKEIQLLEVESGRISEMAQLYKQKYDVAEKGRFAEEARASKLEQKVLVLEGQRRNAATSRIPRAGAAGSGGGDSEVLQAQVDGLKQQGEALKRSFRGAIATKDEEIEILRRMTVEQQEAYVDERARFKRVCWLGRVCGVGDLLCGGLCSSIVSHLSTDICVPPL